MANLFIDSRLADRCLRLLLGSVIAVAALVAGAAAPEPVAHLENVSGAVLVETGDGSYNPYQTGSVLAAGDRIILTNGAAATLEAGDCSLSLDGNSVYLVDGQPCAPAADPLLLAVAPAAASADTAAAMGSIWNDVNSDSIRGPGEGPRAGVRISLANSSCQVGVNCPLATSDTAGNFGFAALEPGTYDVYVEDDDGEFVVIGNVTLEAGTTTTITIASTPAGFVLVSSSVLATAAAVGAGAAIAAGSGTGASTGAAAAATTTTTGAAATTTSVVGATSSGVAEIVGLAATIGVIGGATVKMSNNDSPDPPDISP